MVSDYKACIKSIKQALLQLKWTAILSNNDVHQQINVQNSFILNVFSNFVPNDRGPPWMSYFTESKIYWCHHIYKKNQNSSRSNTEYDILQQTIAEIYLTTESLFGY